MSFESFQEIFCITNDKLISMKEWYPKKQWVREYFKKVYSVLIPIEQIYLKNQLYHTNDEKFKYKNMRAYMAYI